MDIQSIIDGLTPKDYRKEFDAESRLEFDQHYPHADEQIAFLGAHKALPYQHNVESFENPDLFTRMRRDVLGIYTGPEKALLKKQERLLQDQYEPIQQARQKVGTALMLQLAQAPQTDQEAMALSPGAAQLIGLRGQPGSSTALQSAPVSAQDTALASLPFGASSAMAAARPQLGPAPTMDAQTLPQGGLVMEPDTAGFGQVPLQGSPASFNGSPNPLNYGAQFDHQGRPIGPQAAPELPTMPIRAEPIAIATPRLQAAPQPAPTPQNLSIPQRLMMGNILDAQAKGQLVSDGNGGLVPPSFMSADSRLLEGPQQLEAARIFSGEQPSGTVRLPGGVLMQALKGKQEGKAQDVSQPVREYMKSKNLPETPENIDLARNAIRQEKQADEAAQIRLKEGLQAGSQPIKDELKARFNKTNLIDATADEVEKSIQAVTDRNISTDAAKAMNTFNLGGLDQTEKEKLSGLQQLAKVSSRLRTEFTPAERQKYVGYFTLPLSRISQIVRDDPKFAKFDALVNREGIAAFETGGKALTAQESAIIFGFLPNAKEWSPINFEAKLLEADDYTRSKINDIVTVATTNRENIGKEMEKHLPKKQDKPSAAERYNQLSKQGMKDDDIYRQLTVEGIPVGH